MKQTVVLLLFCAAVFPFNSSWAQGTESPLGKAAVDTAFLLPVNGVKQYLEIKGASKTKAVLPFIHGGPSWPATPMNRKYSQDLAKDFVFVSWGQRNCGKSQTDTTVALMPGLYVEDAHVVTQFLKRQYHRRKIFVIGHVVRAPKKQLFLFEHSGHAPSWEEPALFRTHLLRIAAANKAN